jgi:hypothetical protein
MLFSRYAKDFCPFLIERVNELGVNIETNVNVTSVEYDHARKSFSSVQLQSSCGAQQSVPCRTWYSQRARGLIGLQQTVPRCAGQTPDELY